MQVVERQKRNLASSKGIKVTPELHKVFKEKKKEFGFHALNDYLTALLWKTEGTPEQYVSHSNIFSTPAPAIITGEPNSGKTYSVKQIIPQIEGPILCVDPHNEYEMLKMVDSRRISFDKKQRIRVVPSEDPYRFRGDMEGLFRDLLFEKENMKGWTVIIDEAHKLVEAGNEIPFVRSFIIEARKFGIKIIVVCADYKKFEGLGKVLKPQQFT